MVSMNKLRYINHFYQKGFSISELILIITTIGILATLLIPNFAASIEFIEVLIVEKKMLKAVKECQIGLINSEDYPNYSIPIKNVSEIKNKSGLVGYKVEPWLKTTRDDMFLIDMNNVITLSESTDMEMIIMYQHFLKDAQRQPHQQHKLNRRMGYISNVKDAKRNLEKIFKLDSPENTSS